MRAFGCEGRECAALQALSVSPPDQTSRGLSRQEGHELMIVCREFDSAEQKLATRSTAAKVISWTAGDRDKQPNHRI
jgi:hypothetical protein